MSAAAGVELADEILEQQPDTALAAAGSSSRPGAGGVRSIEGGRLSRSCRSLTSAGP
jgi:hypothetical protein